MDRSIAEIIADTNKLCQDIQDLGRKAVELSEAIKEWHQEYKALALPVANRRAAA